MTDALTLYICKYNNKRHRSQEYGHSVYVALYSRFTSQCNCFLCITWAPSSEFVSSSIPSWQILTAHAQPFRGARDLAFCLKVPLDSLLVWASSEGSGETARMRRLAWTFAARIGDKYQIRLTRSTYCIKKCHSWQRWQVWAFSKDLTLTIYNVLGGLGIKNDVKTAKNMGTHVFYVSIWLCN